MQYTRRARTRSTLLTLGMLFAALLLWQCDSRHTSTDTGTLSMNLAANVGGVTYRLRDAVFDVTGPETRVFGTEGSPDGSDDGETTNGGSGCSGAACNDVLTTPLLVGNYQILLRGGWRMERDAGAGFQNVAARLTSANPVGFFIDGGETTRVVYGFEAEGRVITFDRGTLELTIQVEERAQIPELDAAACDFDDPQGCEALSCDAACATNDGGSCRVRCEQIMACVSEPGCLPTEADPMCAARFMGTPNVCTQVVEQGGGPNTTSPQQPAFVARELVRCLCSTPRP